MTTNIDTNALETSISETLEDLGYADLEFLSGYQLARLVSGVKGSEVKPQLTYNYIKKGMIPSVTIEDRKMVPAEKALAWVIKYISRNA